MADTTTTTEACGSCGKTPASLQRCSRCRSERYCNRDCQKAHWKTHKKVCASNANANASANNASAAADGSASNADQASNTTNPTKRTSKNLDVNIPDPFTQLSTGTWLHGRSQRDVYKLLIDAYRMRAEDDYNLEGDVDMDSIMSGEVSTSIRPFKRFIKKIEKRHRRLLPDWWCDGRRMDCEKAGMSRNNWEYLGCAIEKSDIMEHYGDHLMPMQLRMFAEAVIGRGPGGMSGATMMQMMMSAETGENRHVATIDWANGAIHGLD